jgi:hypothetical protein
MSKSRSWVFTLNNYTDADIERFRGFVTDVRYAIIGKEVGESGTPHLQGFLYLHNQVRLHTVRTFFERAHYEIARGTAQQAIDYCKKDGDFIEIGTPPMSNKRKGEQERERYKAAWECAVSGSLDEIDPDIRIRHYGTLKRIQLDHQLQDVVERLPECNNRWYWGPAGTGKSRAARDEFPDAYLKMCNKWWDGYNGQEVVLIEDFDVQHKVLVHHMKIWADIYPFLMEVKGGATKIRPKMIIVTSNYHPSDIWTEDGDLQPILRRFSFREFEG